MIELIVAALKSLCEDAKFSVWANDGQYQGGQNPIIYGEYLIDWSTNNQYPRPDSAQIEGAIESVRARHVPDSVKQEILLRLQEIDLSSIRALRTDDKIRLEDLESEAVTLRQRLQGVVV